MTVNYQAIFVAAVAGWLTGAVWYTIFGKAWMNALGEGAANTNRPRGSVSFYVPFVLAFAANLVIAFVMLGVMRHVGSMTLRAGLISGAFCWFGFALPTIAVNYSFAGRKTALTLIDSGHWLAAFLAIGAALGVLGG